MYVAIHYGGFDMKPYNRPELQSQIAKINYPLKTAIPETEEIRRSYIQKKISRNTLFQFNLSYKIKENINQQRIVFWDPKRQKVTLKNPSLNFQRITVPHRS